MEKISTSVEMLLAWPQAEEKHDRGSDVSPQKGREQDPARATLHAFIARPHLGDDGPGN